MMTLNCEHVRDLLPDLAMSRLDGLQASAIRAHLSGCTDCRDELGLISAVHRQKIELPAGLEQRVLAATRSRSLAPRWSHGRIAMAASISVALLGGSLVLQPYLNRNVIPAEAPGAAVSEIAPAGPGWVGVEAAFITGASSLNDLTVEELEKLLVELDS